jgi:transcription elongation GreA/GreB family factor
MMDKKPMIRNWFCKVRKVLLSKVAFDLTVELINDGNESSAENPPVGPKKAKIKRTTLSIDSIIFFLA